VCDDHLIVSFAGILNENHVNLPDTHLVDILVLVFLHERGDRAEELIETDGVDKETLV
jgi:hypothetical protein